MKQFRHRGNDCLNNGQDRTREGKHNCTKDNSSSDDTLHCEIVYSEAGDDGYNYIYEVSTGNICGLVLINDIGQDNIDIHITTDTQTLIVSTESNGTWCAYDLPESIATIDVDENTIPGDIITRTSGEDNDSYPIISGETTDAGIDTYDSTSF
jgi:hypothetical protein